MHQYPERGLRAGASIIPLASSGGGNKSFCHLKIRRSRARITPRQSDSCLRIGRLLDSGWLGSSSAWSCCSPQQVAVTRLISGIGKLGLREAEWGKGSKGKPRPEPGSLSSLGMSSAEMGSADQLGTPHLGSQVPSKGQVGCCCFPSSSPPFLHCHLRGSAV